MQFTRKIKIGIKKFQFSCLFLKMENCAYTLMSFHVSKILPALRQTVIVYNQLAANTFK
jgi:hypothetical protein